MTFNDKCYHLLSQIPQGKVSTYKEIASVLNTKAYQDIPVLFPTSYGLASPLPYRYSLLNEH